MKNFERLRAVMATILQVPESDVTPESARDELEAWDSVQHLNLMLALEDEFGLQLDVDALQSLTSVAKILEYLDAR